MHYSFYILKHLPGLTMFRAIYKFHEIVIMCLVLVGMMGLDRILFRQMVSSSVLPMFRSGSEGSSRIFSTIHARHPDLGKKPRFNRIFTYLLLSFMAALYVKPHNYALVNVKDETKLNSRVYRHLMETEHKYPIVEIPIDHHRDNLRLLPLQYHKHPTFNGVFSYFPKHYWDVSRILNTFPSRQSLMALKKYNIQHVVLPAKYPIHNPRLKLIVDDPDHSLYLYQVNLDNLHP